MMTRARKAAFTTVPGQIDFKMFPEAGSLHSRALQGAHFSAPDRAEECPEILIVVEEAHTVRATCAAGVCYHLALGA